MKRQGPSFAVPACVSLAVHAAILIALPRYFGHGPESVSRAEPAASDETALVLDPLPDRPPEAPPEEPQPDEFEMGDAAGQGFASQDVKAPTEAVAPEADADQAYLSLDAVGTGESGQDAAVAQAAGEGSTRGQVGGAPPAVAPPPLPFAEELLAASAARSFTPFSMDAEPKLPRLIPRPPPQVALNTELADPIEDFDTGTDEEPLPTTTPAEPPPPPPTPERDAVAATSTPVPAPADVVVATAPPAPPAPLQPEAVAVVTPPHQPTVAPVPMPTPATGSPTAGGNQQPAADPARMSDSESDPFSKLGTATFSDGALQIRFGRKVKTRKPRLLLGGQVDLLTLQRAKIVLGIDIDAAGNVTSVDVVKSSGSNAIDQPTRLAVYEWWFEPKKSPAGQTVPDRVQFTINWR